MQSRTAPSLEILQFNQDDVGPYIRIRVTIADEQIDIRFGLDEFTYIHLRKLLKALFPEHFPSEQYKCFLSFDTHSAPGYTHTGWIVCKLGAQNTRLSFECSELYKSNLEWLKNIDDITDLEDLSWEHWIDAYEFDDSNKDFEILKTLLAEPKARKRSVLKPAIIFIVLCAALTFGWFGVTKFHHISQTALNAPSAKKAAQTFTTVSGLAKAPVSKPIMSANEPASVAKSTASARTSADTGGVLPASLELYHLPAGEVALTFDDGPSEYTEQILGVLAENQVHATFFFIGENVKQWPNVTREAAMEGNEVEDHSVDHGNLAKMSIEQQAFEINQAANTIEKYTHVPVTMFRPPYEAFNSSTKQILSKNGMALALWNQDPEDWIATSSDDVLERVLSLPASGSVFILHDRKYTAEALPAIIQAFKAKHLQLVLLQPPHIQT
jgi:peptidoglycan-N-acetylglucosamine deacetylase